MLLPARIFSPFLGRACAGWLALILLLTLAAPVLAQPNLFQFQDAKKQRISMPFLMQRNLIVIEIRLNGKGPYNFLLDTGIGNSLITDPRLREEVGLAIGARFFVTGAGSEENPLEAYQVSNVAVKLTEGISAPNMSFLMLSNDVLNLSGFVGMPIHGLLGSDVFRSFVVEVSPERQELTFHNPTTFKAPRGRRWVTLPLDMEGRKSYVTVPVQVTDSLKLPLRLVLDTGAGHALSLETTSDPRLQVPKARLRTQLGRGLNGSINGYLGRVKGMQLGRYWVPTLLSSFPDAADVAQRADAPRNGNLGFELLKRFDIVIDYAHNRLMLRPNVTFHDPFEHDMCGFDVLASGPDYHRYHILRVEAGSPAAQGGLQVGDEILSVNLMPAEIVTLNQLTRLLHSADGRALIFVVRRAESGELYTTTIRLKRQI
ncbi:aspartyl protease family protein [Hymenobacter tenuis]